ncbi:hypothetical protein BBJ28_00002513 [Nothophytophthora sp. Chile5]|nr:hypothetical protein BBJ28_00002513 [Nothophytophthora sp. Chile5]
MPESSSPKYYERRDAASASSPLKRQFLQPLPSLMHSMGGYPLEPTPGPKRARILSDVGLDMQASYRLLGNLPRQAMIYPSVPEHHGQQQQQPQEYYSTSPPVVAWNPPRSQVQSPNSAGSASPPSTMRGLPSVPGISAGSRFEAPSVWENVLSTGKFPSDICLSEHGNSTTAPSTPPFTPHGNRSSTEIVDQQSESDASYEVKQGRWSSDEEEYAQTLIEAVKSGEVVLPPNVSVRKFIADSLQCKAMRVSKKFRSLGAASQSPRDGLDEQEEAFTPRDESFNPLSLRSIMNTDATASSSTSDVFDVAEAMANARLIRQSPTSGSPGATKRSSQRVLKRSDYSQHGMVRSGRWSVEEENYAKAMIEAFKSGYLPLHGNVSLRKFLSEVLVCHPMRISKKFVGYVRKYHWYRIAAGKSDPETKRQALHHLCHLERVFWTSLQQNNEWSAGLRRDD